MRFLFYFSFFSFCRYHKSQAIYLESKENTKISCVISSVGANEVLGCFYLSGEGGKDVGLVRAKDRFCLMCKEAEPKIKLT